jgi:hypothetical protein
MGTLDHRAQAEGDCEGAENEYEAGRYQQAQALALIGILRILLARADEGLPPASTPDPRPHSRACGAHAHPHGPDCDRNCPTCGTFAPR